MITNVFHSYIKPLVYYLGYVALLLICTGLDVKINTSSKEASHEYSEGLYLNQKQDAQVSLGEARRNSSHGS